MSKDKCVICDEDATNKHQAFMGQIDFPVCDKHHESTYSAYGYDEDTGGSRMGLQDVDTQEWLDIKSPKRNGEG